MKNKILIMIIFLLIVIIIFSVLKIRKDEEFISNYKLKIEEYQERCEGMEITMIGGSNMEENGNVNSCGYIIKTQNNKLIIVDGGRDIDAPFILDYIEKYGKGTVNYWIITHAHADHVGALIELLDKEDIVIENFYYSLNSLEWYKEHDERGFESEEKMIKALENSKILNKIECQKDQVIDMDNVKCEIIRIANPEITNSDNGNDSSMVFKLIATDVNKSIIFLGDAFYYTSLELLENPEKLKADVVQMAHHGQNGVTKAVYEAIAPELCLFNAPKWLYDNDIGIGYNTGKWQSIEVRGWVSEIGAKSIVAYEGDRTIKLTTDKIEY